MNSAWITTSRENGSLTSVMTDKQFHIYTQSILIYFVVHNIIL